MGHYKIKQVIKTHPEQYLFLKNPQQFYTCKNKRYHRKHVKIIWHMCNINFKVAFFEVRLIEQKSSLLETTDYNFHSE